MMDEANGHRSATLVRELLASMAAGDLDAVLDAYSEDCIYRVSGDNRLSGTYRGRDDIRDVLLQLGALTGGTLRTRVDDVVGGDGYAVVFGYVTAQRDGRSLACDAIAAFKINDQDKFTQLWFLYGDQQGYDEFFR
jgi:ketosteroid isomerase-like protein